MATLTDEGYEVRAADNGAAALLAVVEFQPDLILLDMWMPVVDGWEFARRYREGPGPHAPIIMMAAAANDAHAWSREIGAAATLDKPFEIDELMEVVGRFAWPLEA